MLISLIGTVRILVLASLLLVIAALLALGTERNRNSWIRAALGRLLLAPVLEVGDIRIDTQYNRVIIDERVEEESGERVRLFCFDDLFSQSGVYVDRPAILCEGYTPFYRLAKHFSSLALRVLVIGEGAYTLPRDYLRRNPDSRMDVVEIDSALTQISSSHFFLRSDPRMDIHHEDGRTFVARTRETYDVVFLDAFTSAATIPFYLTTVEFAAAVERGLSSKGVLIVNVLSSIEGPEGRLLRALYRTYRSLFAEVHVFAVDYPDDGRTPQNLIVAALKDKEAVSLSNEDEKLDSYLSHRWQKEIRQDVPLLTDDFTPVAHYMLGTVQYFFEEGL